MLALSDLGESIASGVHVIYSPVRLYLCVSMQPKPEALHAQKEADIRMPPACLMWMSCGALPQSMRAGRATLF